MLSMGTTVSGDSMGALPHEMGDIYGTCSLHEYARGLFYKVDGTGKKLGVTLNILDDVLHSSQEEKTLEVAILDGCSIRNDIPAPTVSDCITFSDFLTADDTPHTVEFDSEKDITYYVVVSGQSFSDVGKFEISVEVRTRVVLLKSKNYPRFILSWPGVEKKKKREKRHVSFFT